ncbi:hypothetical protein CEXT_51461 [Caerostris extrusa]|uniref:Uncharacterized protein n=1 Tax=Caerostris extrusa TaxID=172846 RepID=A0AAV4N7W6_CAEEX|nr:hypothetical protein CEXT_51461 [Caerostris extrusa]
MHTTARTHRFRKRVPFESKTRKSDCHRLFTELALFTHDISTESTAGALLIYKTQAAVLPSHKTSPQTFYLPISNLGRLLEGIEKNPAKLN